MLSSKNNTNNRSQIKIMSTEGHHRDFIVSREKESFVGSKAYSTINSNMHPMVMSSGGQENVVKIPALLSNKHANHTI